MISNLPSNFANLVTPFNPVGYKPVGQEIAENRQSVFKPVEQSAESARTQIRHRQPDDHESRHGGDADKRHSGGREATKQREVAALAARDREVRAHEMAHAAAGGPHTSAPRFRHERGANGVNYAVSGEVSIDTAPASSPEATLDKARQVKSAALAPSQPSPQDLQVAAEADRLARQARAELAREEHAKPLPYGAVDKPPPGGLFDQLA